MITVATLLWDANAKSFETSLAYDESWVEKLYRGFARNLTKPFRFVVFTDRERQFAHEEIEQKPITSPRPIDYAACIEPFKLNEPMILVGLDTIVTGNCDGFADYCMTADKVAVPRDPIYPDEACNGVTLIPGGLAPMMWERFDGRNDMAWINANPHALLDELFPGQVKSYRCQVRAGGEHGEHGPHWGVGDARLIYFHGNLKPHEIEDKFVAEHWR